MGYKMPLVTKEIYLPVKYGESYTFEEYKENFGIDLEEMFDADGKFILNAKMYIIPIGVISITQNFASLSHIPTNVKGLVDIFDEKERFIYAVTSVEDRDGFGFWINMNTKRMIPWEL